MFQDKESPKCGAAGPLGVRPVNIGVGNSLQWDGTTWRVANVGESMIGLVGTDRDFTELPIGALERLMGEGRVVVRVADSDRRADDGIHARLAAASERDLKIANDRFTALQAQWHADRKSRTRQREPCVSGRRGTGRRKRYLATGTLACFPKRKSEGTGEIAFQIRRGC